MDTPVVVATIDESIAGDIIFAGAEMHRVAANRHNIGREGVVAAVGYYLSGVELASVAPSVEAVATVGGGQQSHRIAEIIAAATTDTAIARGGGRHGGGACGAPISIGAYAYEGHIVHIVGATAVASNASGTWIERSHDEVAVMRTSPTPVDVELAVVIIAVEHEAVGSRSVAARIEEGALLVEFGTQQGAEFGIAVVGTGNGSHIGTILEVLHKRRLRRTTDGTASVNFII